MKNRYLLALGGLVIAAFVAMACGNGDDDDNDTNGANGLSGASITVGSKEFTEQLILGYIAVHALRDAGANVSDSTGITGTDNVRTALENGQIDMYWEYTGTGWSVLLGREISDAPDSPSDLYDQVKEDDLDENQIVWMDMTSINNTYALATLRSRSEDMGITTISEYAELVNSNPAEATLCGATEWLTRDDGLPGLAEAYEFDLPDQYIAEVEFTIIPSQVVSGDTCNFGEVFATDGPIAANDLVVLEDDRDFFVPYNVALTVRQEVYDRYASELDSLFGPISSALDDETMQALNARVDVDGEMPEDVAEDWLRENDFID